MAETASELWQKMEDARQEVVRRERRLRNACDKESRLKNELQDEIDFIHGQERSLAKEKRNRTKTSGQIIKDYAQTIRQANGRRKRQERELGRTQDQISTAEADLSAANEVFLHAQEAYNRGPQVIQSKEDGVTVQVRAGWSRNLQEPVTDVIVADAADQGHHHHVIYGPRGEVLYSSRNANH